MYNIAFCDDEKICLDIVSEKGFYEFTRRNFSIKSYRYERAKNLQKDTSDDDFFEIQLDNNEIFKYHASNIFFIEVIGKNCNVVGKQGEHITKCRLSSYKEILEDYGFIQIHKSFLVNYKYIFQIRSNEVVMDDGKILPLSKYRAKEVKEKFIGLVGEK
ncbi:MAG: LytTR family transcriptional regulator [Pseudobutyrivibrio sp.]|nr:LytTR family transcriptional regulator [Pseudobutyrivibrio sp.]